MSSPLGSTSISEETRDKYEQSCGNIAESLVKLVTLDERTINDINNDLVEAEYEISQCEAATNLMIETSKDIKDSILPIMDQDFNDFNKIYKILDILDETVLPSLSNDLNELENLVSHVEDYALQYKQKVRRNNGNISASTPAGSWHGMNIFHSSSRNEVSIENNTDIDYTNNIAPSCNLCNPDNLIKLLNKNENKISALNDDAV